MVADAGVGREDANASATVTPQSNVLLNHIPRPHPVKARSLRRAIMPQV
jgi:hypothetical protein